MMKRVVCGLATGLFVSNFAMADQVVQLPAPACSFSGFYGGVALGYGVTDSALSNRGDVVHFSVKGPLGGLFLGYGQEVGSSRVYLGLEFSALLSGEKGELKKIKLKKVSTVEIAPRFGVVLNNALVYVKVGFVSSKFKTDNDKQSFSGLVFGTGIDLKLSRHMFAGLGCAHTIYGKKIDGNNNAARPISHDVMLRVGYQF